MSHSPQGIPPKRALPVTTLLAQLGWVSIQESLSNRPLSQYICCCCCCCCCCWGWWFDVVVESLPLVLAVASVFGSSREMYLPAMAALASSFSPARHEWHQSLKTGRLQECRRHWKGTVWHITWHGEAQHSTAQHSTAQHSMAQLSMPCIQLVLTHLMHVYH